MTVEKTWWPTSRNQTIFRLLDLFYKRLSHIEFSPQNQALIQQSYSAFSASCDIESQERLARMLNNEIVTDSESEIRDLEKCNTREIVQTKIESINRVNQMQGPKNVC